MEMARELVAKWEGDEGDEPASDDAALPLAQASHA